MLFFKLCPVSYNTPYEKIGDEVRSLTDKVPFDIPDSWEWVRLGTVIELESGQDLTPDKYNDCGKGIPYITGASNIENGNVLINRWTEYGRAFAYCGDVLLTCKGTVGTMAVLQEPQVHIARQIMAIRPISELYVPYIQLVLETLVEDLKAAAKSMIPGIAREDVLQSLFPVPPVSEQKRIVHKVSELSPCLEQYAAADTKLLSLNTGFPEALKKSILQEAVQGKLVPQDPTDEPAETLLERIRAKKQQLIKEGKSKRISTTPSFSEGIILIMRSWTVWSAVSTMNYPLRSRNRGRGCAGGQSQNLFNTGIMHRPNRKDASEWFA